jgi:hypothetical protein
MSSGARLAPLGHQGGGFGHGSGDILLPEVVGRVRPGVGDLGIPHQVPVVVLQSMMSFGLRGSQ